jgi:hypothetical protein
MQKTQPSLLVLWGKHDHWSPATRNRYKTVISRAYSLLKIFLFN